MCVPCDSKARKQTRPEYDETCGSHLAMCLRSSNLGVDEVSIKENLYALQALQALYGDYLGAGLSGDA